MHERLLAVNVLSGGNSLGCNDCVGVVRSRNHHRICLVEKFFIHLAVIGVPLRIRITVENVCGVLGIHVAESDDFLRLKCAEDSRTAASDTYAENLEFSVHRGRSRLLFGSWGSEHARRHRKPDSSSRTCLQERPS